MTNVTTGRPYDTAAEAHFKNGISILDQQVRLVQPRIVQSFCGPVLSAAEEFKKAAELVPDSSDYRYFYAVALRWACKFRSAKEEIRKVLAIDPNHFEAKKTLEYGLKWKDAFSYPKWCETSLSIPETLSEHFDLLPEPGATMLAIVRDGAAKVVCFLNKLQRDLWFRLPSTDMKMKIEMVHSKTPYGSIIASYLVVRDNPTDPIKTETLLNPNDRPEEFYDACTLGRNLLLTLFRQDYTYVIFVDENKTLLLNRKLIFDDVTRSNFMKIAKCLKKIEELGKTMDEARFLQATAWHESNFSLCKISL
jgi:tetratricopeptide (TPR) repeat protein